MKILKYQYFLGNGIRPDYHIKPRFQKVLRSSDRFGELDGILEPQPEYAVFFPGLYRSSAFNSEAIRLGLIRLYCIFDSRW